MFGVLLLGLSLLLDFVVGVVVVVVVAVVVVVVDVADVVSVVVVVVAVVVVDDAVVDVACVSINNVAAPPAGSALNGTFAVCEFEPV